MGWIFTGRDAIIRFVDGARSGEKESFEVALSDAGLSYTRSIDVTPVKCKGRVMAMRKGEDKPVGLSLSWKYASCSVHQDIIENLTGKSTSGPGENLCSSPNDYTVPAWAKTACTVTERIGCFARQFRLCSTPYPYCIGR